jgi:hypothetical protein
MEITCIGCNGYGIRIQKASDKEMLEYLKPKVGIQEGADV